MPSFSFKNLVLYIQVLLSLICVRNFGKVIFVISKHHDGLLNLEKGHIK